MWLAVNWEAVNGWLHTLAVDERMRLNHPTAIRRRFDAAHKPPNEESAHAAGYKAQAIRLQAEVDERNQRIGVLERELAEARDDAAARIAELKQQLEGRDAELARR